jgi:hypothetical protein
MSLSFPRDLVLEAFLSRWVNITDLADNTSLRQVEPVTIEWGANSEQLGKVPPCTAEGVLNNTGGPWTPGNPVSPYWEHLQGRNVPTRLGMRVSRDGFGNRTIGAGTSWGTSETGDGWNTAQFGSYAVGSGVGTVTISGANQFGLCYLDDGYIDCQVAASCTVNVNNVTGGDLEPLNLMLRYQPSGTFAGEHYLLRIAISSAEVLTIKIMHSSLGTLSSVVTVPGLIDAVSAKNLRAKFQVEGHMLRGKVYKKGTAADPDEFEPLEWHVSAQDTRLADAFGFVGIRSGVASGNTNVPVTFEYDDWDARLMRHTGELVKLQPRWDESHRIKTAAFKLADITQRLGRSQRPSLSTAPRRYLAEGHNSEFTVTDHWPLDELPNEPAQGLNTVPASAVAGGAPARFEKLSGTPDKGKLTWGNTDKVLTSVRGFAALSYAGKLILPVNPASLSFGWSFMVAVRRPMDVTSTIQFFTLTNPPGGAPHMLIRIFADGGYELQGNPGGPVTLATGQLTPDELAGNWFTIGLTTFFNGGTNLGFHINEDGQTLGVGNWSTGGFSALSQVTMSVGTTLTGENGGDGGFSNAFVTPQRFDTIIAGTSISNGARASNVLKGWPGESAFARAFRLCAEDGVPFDYWGDTDDTRAMGPQRPIPLLDQLQECADADQAILYGPRYTPGVAFRYRRSMCARPAQATLSYSGRQVAPVMAPAADDRHTANFVKAERIDGGTLIVEQTTGPMNTNDPGTDPDSNAVGKSPAEAKANLQGDAQLGDLGSWVRALGTVPEVRFPQVTVNLRAPRLTDSAGLTVARALLALHPGDRLLVQGMTAADVYRDLDQVVRGGRETFSSSKAHSITFNTAPYDPYRAGVYGDGVSRYDSAVTTLDAQLNSGVTGARNITIVSGERWTTDTAQYPLNVLIGGELVTVSGVTGTGPGQAMTISVRAVNGVAKTHPAGTKVYLHQPVRYC